jgi:dienelactone hydrolase
VVIGAVLGLGAGPPGSERHAPEARVFRFIDRSRTIVLPDGRRIPRPITTIVRFPSNGGPYPLIVFGHGFTLTPGKYSALLRAWTRAGYVVAAPVFPLGNTHAPGGPTEADLPNQPADMSFVITRLLELDRQSGSVLEGRIVPGRIAVAGQSDGAVTALAVAYDSRYRDRRVHAAVILSGAKPTGMAAFPPHGPPLLAVQGTADPINDASYTKAYYQLARRPKFLLLLLGASHLPPYTTEQPQLSIVERVTIDFLDHYLKTAPIGDLRAAGNRSGLSTLAEEP